MASTRPRVGDEIGRTAVRPYGGRTATASDRLFSWQLPMALSRPRMGDEIGRTAVRPYGGTARRPYTIAVAR